MNDLFKKKICTYLFQNPSIPFALLFGSSVKGTEHELSDIDVGVYFTEPVSFYEFGNLVCDLENLTGKRVDLVELNDLYHRDARFAYQMVLSSALLFCKNENLWVEYKTKVILYCLNIEPLLRRVEACFKKRIEEKKFGIHNYA